MSQETPERQSRRARYFTKWFAIIGSFAGLAMFVGQILYTTYSVRGIDGLQVERVKIVTEQDADGSCGKSGTKEDFTFESSNPPAGLPAVFTLRGQCLPVLDQGDSIPFVREVKDGRVVKNWIDPTLSYSEAFWTSLGSAFLAFAFVFAVCWIGLGIRQVWLRFFWHD